MPISARRGTCAGSPQHQASATERRLGAGLFVPWRCLPPLAFLTLPAQAQMGGRRHQGDDRKSEQKKPQVDEKACKAALEQIPEPKEKYDPWSTARPTTPEKKRSK